MAVLIIQYPHKLQLAPEHTVKRSQRPCKDPDTGYGMSSNTPDRLAQHEPSILSPEETLSAVSIEYYSFKLQAWQVTVFFH